MSFFNRIRALFHKDELDRQLSDELAFHLEKQIEKNLAAGMAAEEARFAAMRSFGGVDQVKEECRDAWGVRFIDTLVQDIRFSLRQLRKNPGFTVVAVLTLALGIGANTAIFSLIDAVMLKTLPVKDPGQLVMLRWQAREWPKTKGYSGYGGCPHGKETGCSFSYPTFQAIRNQRQVFADVFAAPGMGNFIVIAQGEANPAMGELASGEFFSTLGVKAELGRTFTPQDDQPGSPPVVVVSHEFWLNRLGADPAAVGKLISVDGVPFTVVGVASPQFRGIQPGLASDVWLPLSAELLLSPAEKVFDGGVWRLQIVGRLKPGVKTEQARAALEVSFLQTVNAFPEWGFKPEDQPHLTLDPASRGLGMLRQFFAEPLLMLWALTGLVLLIACANLANLMLVRTILRQREIAVRRALGAGRARLVRQLLTESILLATVGGVFGIFAAWQGSSLLAAFIAHNWWAPLSLDATPNWRVLLFTAAVSVAVGTLSGLVPALRGTATDLTPALKDAPSLGRRAGGRGGRSLLRSGLVVWQVTLATLVLVGAGLFVRTLQKLQSADLGFNPHNLLLFEVSPQQSGYKNDAVNRLYQQVMSRVSALPGVASASFSRFALVSQSLNTDEFWIGGAAHPVTFEADILPVGPGFFETMKIPILAGRGITAQDVDRTRRVGVVNAEIVRRYFPGQNPLGREFGIGQDRKNTFEIVGVVGNAKYADVPTDIVPTVYGPLWGGSASFALRTAIDPAALIPSVRRSLREIDPKLPLLSIRTQTEQIGRTLFEQRLIAGLASLFGALALILACVGLYGIVSYGVAQRTHEIGIRVALGAGRGDILKLVLRQGVVLTLAGLALGLMAAGMLARLVKAFLYGVQPMDPLTFVGGSLLLLAVQLIASYIPARRATKVDPMVALRYE